MVYKIITLIYISSTFYNTSWSTLSSQLHMDTYLHNSQQVLSRLSPNTHLLSVPFFSIVRTESKSKPNGFPYFLQTRKIIIVWQSTLVSVKFTTSHYIPHSHNSLQGITVIVTCLAYPHSHIYIENRIQEWIVKYW